MAPPLNYPACNPMFGVGMGGPECPQNARSSYSPGYASQPQSTPISRQYPSSGGPGFIHPDYGAFGYPAPYEAGSSGPSAPPRATQPYYAPMPKLPPSQDTHTDLRTVKGHVAMPGYGYGLAPPPVHPAYHSQSTGFYANMPPDGVPPIGLPSTGNARARAPKNSRDNERVREDNRQNKRNSRAEKAERERDEGFQTSDAQLRRVLNRHLLDERSVAEELEQEQRRTASILARIAECHQYMAAGQEPYDQSSEDEYAAAEELANIGPNRDPEPLDLMIRHSQRSNRRHTYGQTR